LEQERVLKKSFYLVYIEVANNKQEVQKPLHQNPTSKSVFMTSSNAPTYVCLTYGDPKACVGGVEGAEVLRGERMD
jgi:hypothetical protein